MNDKKNMIITSYTFKFGNYLKMSQCQQIHIRTTKLCNANFK